jgi:hypothetical protein
LDQPLLEVPLELDLAGAGGLGSGDEGGRQPLGDEALPHPLDGSQAGALGGDDGLVAAVLARGGVRQQQDAGVGELTCRPLAGRDQML